MKNPLDRIRVDIDKYIINHGWSILGVMDTPPFSYTVGLHLKNLPEFIATGVPCQIAHGIINECASRSISIGGFKHGTVIDDLVNLPVTLIDAPNKEDYAIQAFNYYGHWNFPLQQIVFPDKGGKFPWESGYQYTDIDAQPLLGTL